MKSESVDSRAAEARAARRNVLILCGSATITLIALIVAVVLVYPE